MVIIFLKQPTVWTANNLTSRKSDKWKDSFERYLLDSFSRFFWEVCNLPSKVWGFVVWNQQQLTLRWNLLDFGDVVLSSVVDWMCDAILLDDVMFSSWWRTKHCDVTNSCAELRRGDTHTTWKTSKLVRITIKFTRNIYAMWRRCPRQRGDRSGKCFQPY